MVDPLEVEHIETDVVVIGAGVAGCFFAVHAADEGLDVTLVDKAMVGKSGCSRIATQLNPKGEHVWGDDGDDGAGGRYEELDPSEKLSFQIKYKSHFLWDQEFVLQADDWIENVFFDWMEEHGLYVRRMEDGSLLQEGGSIYPFRTTWAPRQGQGNVQIMDLLRHEVMARDEIRTVEECSVTRLLTDDDGVAGAVGIGIEDGTLYVLSGKFTVMAAGQAANITTRTTATREVTGNSYVMAYDAGAEIRDLEMWYIHVVDNKFPRTFNQHCYPNPNPNTDKTPHMFNSVGEFYFTPDMYRRETPVMYPLQYKLTVKQIMDGKANWDGGYFSSYQHMVDDYDEEYQSFKKDLDFLQYQNVAERQIENAMNFEANFIGGIVVDRATGRTAVPRLYAIGGASGINGFETCSFTAWTALQDMVDRFDGTEIRALEPDMAQVEAEEARLRTFLETDGDGPTPRAIATEVREVMTEAIFPWKNAESLETALNRLEAIRQRLPEVTTESTTRRYNQEWIEAADLEDMVRFSELYLHAALGREESRGPFFRSDFPYVDNEEWLVNHVLYKAEDGSPAFRKDPVELPYLEPEEGRADYFEVVY